MAQDYFADVILPQALPGLLTYRVPMNLVESAARGKRVVVPLGQNKLYTGVIRHVHQKTPLNYQPKSIDSILDDYPVVIEDQLLMWEWMSGYYCCTVGEVMNAALPAGLKLSGETRFILQEDVSEEGLSERELVIIHTLKSRGRLTVNDAVEVLGIKNVMPIMKTLIERGLIRSEEEVKEKYRPKMVEMIELGVAANSEQKLQEIFSTLERRRAEKQSDALLLYLKLSGWDEGKVSALEKSTLVKQQVQSATIQAMVDKEIFHLFSKQVGRLNAGHIVHESVRTLSDSQEKAKREVLDHWKERDVCLLHGVTSSGKTEVYVSLIEQVLNEGKQVLFLLPEIALTTQIIHRIRKYFGKRVGVYHSGYSDNERTEVWQQVLSNVPGECDIILGARSALFLPFTRLGLVIVDEEHEQSYKQHDPAPRYHARDTSLWLARKFGAKVLLGSATPSFESYWNAKNSRFGLVNLNQRFGNMELPEVVLSDIRHELKERTMKNNFSSLLLNEIQGAVDRGEQVILFQNRRGYSPLWKCETCGWVPSCTRCDVSLTYHKRALVLKCHYCGYSTPPVGSCQQCGSQDMKMLGFGTEKIEEDLDQFLPGVRVQRMDYDTTRSKSSYQKIIGDFESGVTHILVGTQMVTKGLDFDNVSLVGIMNADKMMNYPDFRSLERSFQIMMQVAGRAGRKNKRGKVIIQTYQPDHWMFSLINGGNYQALYEKEIAERHHFAYPPFTRLMNLTLKHRDESIVASAAHASSKALIPILKDHILGPEPPYIPRINNYYLQQMLVRLEKKAESEELKHQVIHLVRQVLQRPEFKQVKLQIDVDPL